MDLLRTEKPRLSIEGHVIITDPDSGAILTSRRNAINFENFSTSIANLLANNTGTTGSFGIKTMRFGDGGTVIDGGGNLTIKSTNANIVSGELHNQTYSQTVDDNITGSVDNQVTVTHTANTDYSDVVITCTVDTGYPTGSDFTDVSNLDDYVFDEIGIFNANDDMLTHVIFSPLTKPENRRIQVVYTIRIRTAEL